ncbi:hypothetical protein M426DRAFT_315924 [Hypoxylon sp. CI-4A]|nr:hypothetical protein M426DRAFT_315924 [Hypoxylon sp. CI-4A]
MPALHRFLLLSLPVALAGASAVMKRAPTSPFALYAYGDNIGGAAVFTTGSGAYIGNSSVFDDAEADTVEFQMSTESTLVGSPNATTGVSPSWSNLTFSVPDDDSSDHQVSFQNSTSGTGRLATGFLFYGDVLLHKNTDSSLNSLWYVVPTEYDDVWALNWNETGDETDGKVLVSLRTTVPTKSSKGK